MSAKGGVTNCHFNRWHWTTPPLFTVHIPLRWFAQRGQEFLAIKLKFSKLWHCSTRPVNWTKTHNSDTSAKHIFGKCQHHCSKNDSNRNDHVQHLGLQWLKGGKIATKCAHNTQRAHTILACSCVVISKTAHFLACRYCRG